MKTGKTRFGVYIASILLMLVSVFSAGVAVADESGMDVWEHMRWEEGSTDEWEGGDYVALNMTENDTLAWFGVVYGNDTHPNGITLVSAYVRFLGGMDVRDENGGMMMGAQGIPVLTIYVQKLGALIEFNDTGYQTLGGERVGAGNGVFDFQRSGFGIDDLEFSSVEPVYKILDLNRSWERTPVVESKVIGNNHSKEWDFSIYTENVTYDKIWDGQPAENPDGSRTGTPADGAVDRLEFSFHVSADVKKYKVDVPWYDVQVSSDGEVVASTDAGTVEYEGTSVTTDFKFDHIIQGWDYTAKSGTSKLMLENVVLLGTFIPDMVQSWLDVEYPSGKEEVSIMELETFTGGEEDIAASDGVPDESTMLKKDSIVFKDRWRKIGELTWIDKAEVDGSQEDIYYQVHAGQGFDWRLDEDEDMEGSIHGLFFIGGYIYPAGADIYHDPSFITNALLLDIGSSASGIVTFIVLGGGFGTVAVAAVAWRRKRSRSSRQMEDWEVAMQGLGF